MIVRRLFVAALAAVVAVLTLFSAGAASAEPQLPRLTLYSDNFGTVGDHDYCRGALNVGVVAPKGKPGTIRVTVTSFGFTGNGPGWQRDPNCRFQIFLSEISAKYPLGVELFFPDGAHRNSPLMLT